MNWAWMRLPGRVPFIPQMEVSECGAASLTMVLAYHGYHVPLPEVRQACAVSREGASGLGILRAARAYGLDAEGVTLEIRELKALPLPAVLHWGFRHFVVLERLLGRGAVVVDPAAGRRTADWTEMERLFTGVALVFAPGDLFEKRAATRPSVGRYRDLLWRVLPSIAQLLIASLTLELVALVPPVTNQLLLDRVLLPRQESWLWGLAFGLGAAALTRALLKLVRSWVIQNFSIHVDLTLMGGFLDHLLHLPLAFFLQRTPGDLFQRVQSNTLLRDLFGTRMISALLDGLMVVGYAALMMIYNVRLASIVLVLGAVRVAFLIAIRRRNRQIMSAELAASGRESSALIETLSALETVKASGAEANMVRRWSDRLIQRVNHTLGRRNFEILSSQLMSVLQGIGTAAILWTGGGEVIAEHMTIGVFVAFLMLQGLFMNPLESLLGAVTQLQYMSSHLFRLDDVLEAGRETSGAFDPGRLIGAIELDDVSFSYSSDGPDVVQGVTLRVEPGEKIALVGPTGAGKSTLARLLLGMHLPKTGVIRFDGIDVRSIDLPRLRQQMGVVLQDAFFFSGTVRANLSLNDTEIPLARLREAAAMACAGDVIDALPEGYETRLWQNANIFSGGERQRLSLARAIAHDPAILLLDEATSALDHRNEEKIHANLAKMKVTRIIIAHRLATVEDADRILVMQSGRIVQEGDFETLSEQPGLFRQLLLATGQARV